jgi:hypothetical protein
VGLGAKIFPASGPNHNRLIAFSQTFYETHCSQALQTIFVFRRNTVALPPI